MTIPMPARFALGSMAAAGRRRFDTHQPAPAQPHYGWTGREGADRARTGTDKAAPALAAKVDFLKNPASYASPRRPRSRCGKPICHGCFSPVPHVYKLKKPVRFPYLDFSTLARREAACRAELRLNRRLAPDVYLGVVPLTRSDGGLALGGEGAPVDWLVKMQRLDERDMLDRRIADGRLSVPQLDDLTEVLARFYRAAAPVFLSPAVHLADFAESLAFNKRVLLDPRFALPAGLVRRIDAAQRRFLARHGDAIAMRIRHRRIVEGHGDLRPEHICLDHEVRIIDCIEFNPRLRVVDPFDEIAYLGARMRAARRQMGRRLSATPDEVPAARRPGRRAVHLLPLPPRHLARAARHRASGWKRIRARRRNGSRSHCAILSWHSRARASWRRCSKRPSNQ